jgi:hypothetical protein
MVPVYKKHSNEKKTRGEQSEMRIILLLDSSISEDSIARNTSHRL